MAADEAPGRGYLDCVMTATASGYQLVDSGEGEKLERIGNVLVIRPSPQALWSKSLGAERWSEAISRYERSSKGGGQWNSRREFPEPWVCEVGGQSFSVKPTGFGHVGFFAEQAPFWEWIRERSALDNDGRSSPIEVLNLFAYTGGSTVAAARGGASITHCDAARGSVQWASDNARLNGLNDAPIRWIVDDAMKFLRRQARRERTYQGIVLDPPTFGRGPKGEVWKLEENLEELLAACAAVLATDACFVLFSAHTPGIGSIALRNILTAALRDRLGSSADEGAFGHGEMWIEASESPHPLPSGNWSAWSRDRVLPPVDPWTDRVGPERGAPA